MDLTRVFKSVKNLSLSGVLSSNWAIGIGLFALAVITTPRKQGEDDMGAPKTSAVLFKDGTEGRGVKLTSGNAGSVATWLGEKKIELVFDKRKGIPKDEDQIWDVPLLKVQAKGGKRVATAGDIVVKVGRGSDAYFRVVKAEDFEKYITI